MTAGRRWSSGATKAQSYRGTVQATGPESRARCVGSSGVCVSLPEGRALSACTAAAPPPRG
jgi:hypothetical protein